MLFSRKLSKVASVLIVTFMLTSLFGCNPGGAGTTGTSEVSLHGAGATFPMPLYQKWISEYGKLKTNVKIDYQSIGSGGGIKQIQAQTVDFGASDSPMKDEDLKAAAGGALLHIPTVLGAVVLTYNLGEVKEPLRFSPDVIADIFLGKIRKWNDPRIKADNPNAALGNTDVVVVHRSDGSGTSAVFTEYLSKVSPEWKEKVGSGPSPSWPIGIGGKGSEGVTGQIKNTPNTIGYVELAYAVQNKLPVALVKNAAGEFIEPTFDAVTKAASESLSTTPDDLRVSITNAAGKDAYPISSYTYLLVYQDQKDANKGKALVDYLWWAIHDGQSFAKDLKYAPLPAEIVKRAEAKVNSVTSGGKALRS
jgi:phosphate transport system substrate-binding protein